MGSAQSATSKATAAPDKYSGLYNLSPSQSNTLKMISDIFEQLLSDKGNNIFSLEKVLGSPDQCSALLIILSNSLEKDFHTLVFPDPLKPNNTVNVSYMLQNDYKELENEPNRKSLCVSLIFFMIRLITLIAAVTASLQINNNIVSLLNLVEHKLSSAYNIEIKTPKFDRNQTNQITSRSSLSDEIINSLKKGGLTEVLTEDRSSPDLRNLYFFLQHERSQNPIILDASSSFLYFGKEDESSIYGITIREIDSARIKLQEERAAAAAGMSGGRTRKNRKNYRKTFKRIQRGGELSLFSVNLTRLFCSACEKIPEFYMESDGSTYEVNDYLEKIRGHKLSIPTLTLQERMEELEKDSDSKIELMVVKLSELPMDEFRPLSKVDKETIHAFKTIQDTIKTKQEGTSPCFYRSYLLAARMESDKLITLICGDQWAQHKTTNQVAYSLLQALYYDRPDATMDAETAKECANTIGEFSAVLDPNDEPGFTLTFNNMSFKPIPDEVDTTICNNGETFGDINSRPIREGERIRILAEAHKNLHELFESHIKNCVELLLKIVSIEKTEAYLGKPKINLDPIFVNHSKGSLYALEEFIKEGRKMIAGHYLTTETIYQNAISELVRLSRGNINSSDKKNTP